MLSTLAHTVLGLLLDRPMHGYQLKRALSPALGRRQRVNDGVLYPLLARLERDGFVRKDTDAESGPRPRNVYRPTPRGVRVFEEWLASNVDEADAVTYDFFLGHPFLNKCMFLRRLPGDEVLRKLERHAGEARDKLREFERIRAEMVARSLDAFRIALIDLGIAQQQAKVRWLETLRGDVARRPRAYGLPSTMPAGVKPGTRRRRKATP